MDYLSNLGVNCIWLLPIYPSPLRDDGYDVADYCGVHPHYGTIEDFQTLVNAVHERNMRIIADLIPNHTSDEHEWFKKSRADRNGPYRDYYVWTDNPEKYNDARIIFVDTEKSNWVSQKKVTDLTETDLGRSGRTVLLAQILLLPT